MTTHTVNPEPIDCRRWETGPVMALLRPLLLTAVMSATAGALIAVAALDRLPDAVISPPFAPLMSEVPATAPGRESDKAGAQDTYYGREAAPDDPAASHG